MRVHLLEPRGALTVDVVLDVLSLIAPAPVARAALERLTSLELSLVYDWATREHARASDRPVYRRDRPSCLDLAVVVSSFLEIAAQFPGDDRAVMAQFRARVTELSDRSQEKVEPAKPPVPDVVGSKTESPALDWPLDRRFCPQYRVKLEFVLRLPPGSPPPTPTSEAVDAAALTMSGPPFDILPGARVGYTVVRSKSPAKSPAKPPRRTRRGGRKGVRRRKGT